MIHQTTTFAMLVSSELLYFWSGHSKLHGSLRASSTHHPHHRFMTFESPARVRFQTRPISPVGSVSSTAHSARCNLCDSRIRGDRYKCTECPDFDTCASCFAITSEQHPFHAFVKVTRPGDFMVRNFYLVSPIVSQPVTDASQAWSRLSLCHM